MLVSKQGWHEVVRYTLNEVDHCVKTQACLDQMGFMKAFQRVTDVRFAWPILEAVSAVGWRDLSQYAPGYSEDPFLKLDTVNLPVC